MASTAQHRSRAALARVVIRDTAGLIGLVLIGTGLWLVYPPAALITVGALLFGAAAAGTVLATRRAPR